MARGALLCLVGFLALVLFGCSHSWFQEREPWRHEAEAECLQSGSVRERPGVTLLNRISGPGICGADFPLKVSALSSESPLGFADDPRPSAEVPRGFGAAGVTPPAPPGFVSTTNGIAPPMRLGAPEAAAAEEGPLRSYSSEAAAADDAESGSAYPAGIGPVGPGYPRTAYPPAGETEVKPAATLACPMVSALDLWIANAIQPAAQRWFGEPVVEIKQISAYSCRSMNGQWGAPISEHAFGNALDVAAFTLADGRVVTVRQGWHGRREERGFLHDIHAAACRQFSTVLAPGSNAFHYDHIHVDLARRASGRSICSPTPESGQLVAGAPGGIFTNSVGTPTRRTDTSPNELFGRSRGPATPGED